MSYDDFVQQFSNLSICKLPSKDIWKETQLAGSWTMAGTHLNMDDMRDRAGGGPNYPDTYLRNPQYRYVAIEVQI